MTKAGIKKKVWRIFHFQERFELPDDYRKCRVTPLLFVKDYVGISAGDEAAGYHNQWQLLSNGDGLGYLTLIGAYRQLITFAASHSRAKRGYLLDAKDDPLSTLQLSKMLNVPAKNMARILKRFVSVDLLEYVDMPKFDLTINDQPPDRENTSDSMGGDTKKRASQGQKRGSGGNGRKRAEISASERTPLKKRQSGKRQKVKVKVKVNKGKATGDKTAVAGRKKNNGNSADTKVKAQNKGGPTGQVKDEPPSAPTTTPPLPSEPHVSDALGGSNVIPFTTPRTSLKPASKLMGCRRGIPAGDYDKHDEQVGTRVYVALGYRWSADSPEARREITSFASVWHKARQQLSGLPPPVVDELGRRAIVEARKIARRGKRNRKPGAVWIDVLRKLLDARIREVTHTHVKSEVV